MGTDPLTRPNPLRRLAAAAAYRLGGYLPGAAARRAQVEAFATQWRAANCDALRATGPLWVVLGDSTSQGIGASVRERGYVGQVLDALRRSDPGWRVVNLSRTGARTADVVDRQLAELDRLPQPALVTCAIGVNDLTHRTPQLAGVLTDLLSRLPGGTYVATLPQGVRARYAAELNAGIRAQAPPLGLHVVDLWAFTGPPWQGEFSADLFHPNDAGYADWARAFRAALPHLVRER
ncbi:MAG: SGNH/GDSL hydrolase family protein [Pseudonocardia sp.]